MATVEKNRREKKRESIWDTLRTIFWALLIAAAFRSFLYQPFSIPSGSMKPTLLIGDYLFVTKYAYGYSRFSFPFSPDLFSGRIFGRMPKRGDVIVFKHPSPHTCAEGPLTDIAQFLGGIVGEGQEGEGDCVDYVKRLVGLPGDTIQVRHGILYVNGTAAKTEQVDDFVEPKVLSGSPPRPPLCMNSPVPLGGTCIKQQFRETFPDGNTHYVLNITGTVGGDGSQPMFADADNTPVFTVPPDRFFFMGDNRDNSVDSRFPSVGYVPFQNLIGRADLIAVSSDGPLWEFWNWRFDRFFKRIE